MTKMISALALGVGMLLASAQTSAHGHHSHGPALTEAEVKASEGILPMRTLRIGRLATGMGSGSR